jgi:hypothetical protein
MPRLPAAMWMALSAAVTAKSTSMVPANWNSTLNIVINPQFLNHFHSISQQQDKELYETPSYECALMDYSGIRISFVQPICLQR